MTGFEFHPTTMQFAYCTVSNPDLIRYLWPDESPKNMQLIHAPSHFDDLPFGYTPNENKAGEDAFYEALNEAYKQFKVEWVLFVNTAQ